MTTERAEFPARVRRLIAERAGYRCSKPDCRRPTLGPGPGPNDIVCIGTASHVYSAAPGGPRGTGGLTFEERQSASNGIWLCADHSRLIDTNQGWNYPAQLLHSWRRLHETYLTQEMRGLVTPYGLITEITVRQGPAALVGRAISLSILNVVVGYNETGKSTLLDLLACVAAPDRFSGRSWNAGLAADIQWFDPQPHMLRLHTQDGRVSFALDQKPVPFLPAPYRPVVVRTPRRYLTGIRDVAELLHLDTSSFLNLLVEVPDRVQGQVSHVEVVNGAPLVRLRSWPEPVQLEGHPGSAAVWTVVFETAIALAQVYAETGPTLLLIDDFGEFFHPKLTHEMFKLLTDRTRGFQTVVVTHCLLPAEVQQHWSITAFLDHEYDAMLSV